MVRLRRRRRADGTFYPISAAENARRHEAWHAHAYEEEGKAGEQYPEEVHIPPLSVFTSRWVRFKVRLRRWFRGIL